ncbi:MAG: hypothetical protein WCJ11_08075 [Methylococcaceae bacterium]
MTDENTPKPSDYIKTYHETKKADLGGVAGKTSSTILGGIVGWLGATPIAGWFGGTVISTSGLGTVLSWLPAGLVKAIGITSIVTVTTPVAWVVGSIAICSAIGFGIQKLTHSGGMNDEKRRKLGKELLAKLQKLCERRTATPSTDSENSTVNSSATIAEIETLFHELANEGVIKPEKVATYVENLKSGRLPIDVAINILNEHGKELVNPSLNPNADVDAELSKAASARAFTAMNKGVTNAGEPSEEFLSNMKNRFGVERGRAIELYCDAPLDPNPKETAQQLGQIFSNEVIGAAFDALAETAHSMNQGAQAYSRFMEISAVLDKQFDTIIETMEKDVNLHAAIGRL